MRSQLAPKMTPPAPASGRQPLTHSPARPRSRRRPQPRARPRPAPDSALQPRGATAVPPGAERGAAPLGQRQRRASRWGAAHLRPQSPAARTHAAERGDPRMLRGAAFAAGSYGDHATSPDLGRRGPRWFSCSAKSRPALAAPQGTGRGGGGGDSRGATRGAAAALPRGAGAAEQWTCPSREVFTDGDRTGRDLDTPAGAADTRPAPATLPLGPPLPPAPLLAPRKAPRCTHLPYDMVARREEARPPATASKSSESPHRHREKN